MPVIRTESVEATQALGRLLGTSAPAGTIVALLGDLGAGKTAFSQGVGDGLGVGEEVVSPTFIVVSEHEGGRVPLVHADLYRIDDPEEIEQIGLEERLEDDVIGLVEWADKHPHVLPADHLVVRIVHAGSAREVQISATGPRHTALLGLFDG